MRKAVSPGTKKNEPALKDQYTRQQLEQFSGHRPSSIQQDYAASLFVANLQCLVENNANLFSIKEPQH